MVHACEHRLCPVSCQLCKRLCSGDHLHGLDPDQYHLCGCVRCPSFMDVIKFSLLDKSTLVAPCVLPLAYAKLIRPPSPSRLHSLAGMKLSNTRRYASLCWGHGLIYLSHNLVYTRYVFRNSALPSLDHLDIAAKRLRCVKIIEPGEVGHPGPHVHNNEKQPFHFCESR